MDVDNSLHVKRAHSHNGPTTIIPNMSSVSDDPRLRYHPNLTSITPPITVFLPSFASSSQSYDIGGLDSDRNADYVGIMRYFIHTMIWGKPIVIRT